eukprot:gene32874-60906_t
MDFDSVVLADPDVLFLHDPAPLFAHHQPAVAVGAGSFDAAARGGRPTHTELLRVRALGRTPDAG